MAKIMDLSKMILNIDDVLEESGLHKHGMKTENVSDGYHTFESLYRQRAYLFAALVKAYSDKAWKTWKHEDGELCFGGGWFLVGIETPAGQYTYHYEADLWDIFECKEIEKAPHWDGHTDADVARLLTLEGHISKKLNDVMSSPFDNQLSGH